MTAPKVTVSLITYNHAPFITQAIESVLAQRTDFPFELVIGEDGSTDGTREIVQRFAAEHPERIRVHFHDRSANIAYGGMPTGRRNFVHNLRSARGSYIALLDGDDYFTDPDKLQLQADFLDANPDFGTCFHAVRTVNTEGRPMGSSAPPEVMHQRYTLEDLLDRKVVFPTASVLFRRGLFEDFPDWYYECAMGDFPLHVLNGLRGDFGYIDREMAAYRVHAGGRWSAASDFEDSDVARQQARSRKLRQYEGVVHLYEILTRAGLGPAHARALREGIATYNWHVARMLREQEDWPALRRQTWRLFLARPLPKGVPWSAVLRMSLEALVPSPVRKAVRAWRGQPA